ncbi:hypothetical protein Tco_0083455 [Tanacetum coccineum]
MADLLQDNLALGERLDKHGIRLYNLEKLDIPHKVSQAVDEIFTDAVNWAMQALLRARFKDLATRRDAPRSPPGSPPSQPPPPPPPASASGAPGTSRALGSSQLPPPPPPPSTGTSGSTPQQGHKFPSSSKTTTSAQQSMAWTTFDTRYKSTGIAGAQELSPLDDLMHDDSAPDEQVQVSDDQDSGDDHTPAAAASRKDWWKPLPEEERPTTPEPAWTILPSNVSDVENNWASALASSYEPPAENSLLAKTNDMTTFLNWYCRQINKSKLTQADLEGQAYEVVKVFYPDIIHLQFQMEECHKMLTNQVDWANPEDQVRINVNRLLPLGGPPGHVTIQTKFFFNKDLEYLRFGNKGSMPVLSISKMKVAHYPDFGLKLLVSEQMWIEDVCTYNISAKYAYSRYGYDYLSEIVLRRADFQEHTIAKKDFKNLYPSDFEDLNLLLLQGHLDHLSGLDKRMLSSCGPSQGIQDQGLNPGMNTRFWTEKDVTRSKEFITAIERRLKTRRIYRNLECFVGGRVRDIDYKLLQRTE